MHVAIPFPCTLIICLVFLCGVTDSVPAAQHPAEWTGDDLKRLTTQKGVLNIDLFAQEVSEESAKQPLAMRASNLNEPAAQAASGLAGQLAALLARALANAKADAGAQNAISKARLVLAIRDWCMRASGYGNLLLAYQCEETALRLLFPLLARPNPPLSEMQGLSQRLCSGTPTCEQWLAVLRTEQIPEIVSRTDLEGLPEYKRLGVLFEKLQSPEAESTKAVPLLAGGSELPATRLYPDCLKAPSLPQLAWNAFLLALKKNSLGLLLEYIKKAGALPKERQAFRTSVKKILHSKLLDCHRLGGRMDSGGLWTIYKREVLSVGTQ